MTRAEYRVAHAMLWDGASNQLVAKRLKIAENTVKHYCKVLLKKTQSTDRLHLGVGLWSGRVVIKGPGDIDLLTDLRTMQELE